MEEEKKEEQDDEENEREISLSVKNNPKQDTAHILYIQNEFTSTELFVCVCGGGGGGRGVCTELANEFKRSGNFKC